MFFLCYYELLTQWNFITFANRSASVFSTNPVPKSTDKSVSDFPPISLLPIPAKIAEKVILSDIKPILTNCLGDCQFGIRKRSSTTHAIVTAHDLLPTLADDPGIGAAVFIGFDLSKAFDKISHRGVVLRSLELNLPTGFTLFLRDYLYNRQQRVSLHNNKSKMKILSSDVPQGSLLGPFLFGMQIATLHPRHPSTCMIKYVDDLCIIAGIRKANATMDIARLKSEISNIKQWTKLNDMVLNVDKSVGLIRYRGNFGEEHKIEDEFGDINFCSRLRFLGVIFDKSLGWGSHVDYLEKKCSQRIYILRRMKSITSDRQFVAIYVALIRSVLEYASPAFIGLSKMEESRLRQIQRRCLKVKGQIHLPDLAARRLSYAQKFFCEISSSDTFIKDLLPLNLPSGRTSVPFCRTSLRRRSFIPTMCILSAASFYD